MHLQSGVAVAVTPPTLDFPMRDLEQELAELDSQYVDFLHAAKLHLDKGRVFDWEHTLDAVALLLDHLREEKNSNARRRYDLRGNRISLGQRFQYTVSFVEGPGI